MNLTAWRGLGPALESETPNPSPHDLRHADLALAALSVTHLRKAYKKVRAVNDISFSIAPGEIVGLLGPNGAGKTTTMEMILGLRQPDAGSVRIFGEPVGKKHRRYKSLIGAQLQRTEFPGSWRVREVLNLFATFYPRPLPPDGLIERFGLVEKRDALVKTLSGGQLRRLGLAVALVGQPRVVLLDEPTSGLDAHARRSLWETIREMRESGLTLLLSSHSMEEAERLCDRVAIIDEGRILAMDSPQQLIRSYSRECAIEFETVPRVEPYLLDELPVASARSGEFGRFALFTEDPMPTLAALTAWAVRHGVTVTNVQMRTATLEDVFVQMTGRRIQS